MVFGTKKSNVVIYGKMISAMVAEKLWMFFGGGKKVSWKKEKVRIYVSRS